MLWVPKRTVSMRRFFWAPKTNVIMMGWIIFKFIYKYFACLYLWWFVCFNTLCPSQQFFSHVGTGLPGLNHYKAEDKVSCSRTQCSASGEARTCNPSIWSQALYHWVTVLLYKRCQIAIFQLSLRFQTKFQSSVSSLFSTLCISPTVSVLKFWTLFSFYFHIKCCF